MKILAQLVVVLAMSLGMAARTWAAPIDIHVFTALAPNSSLSPSFPGWEANAVSAMMKNGAATAGTPGTPEYFQQGDTVNSAEATVTDFAAWLGKADPAKAFGAGFANESGNRMTFPLWINGNGNLFSIADLGFSISSTDPFNGLGLTFTPGGYDYSAGYVGLQYGADNARGGGDDVLITGGLNTQLVNELFGRGSGNSFFASCPACSLADQQLTIDDVASYPGIDFSVTGTYVLATTTLTGDDYSDRRLISAVSEGSARFNVIVPAAAVPEPGTLALFATGLVLAGGRRRIWNRWTRK